MCLELDTHNRIGASFVNLTRQIPFRIPLSSVQTGISGSAPVLDTSLSAVTMSWQYVGETIFNMIVLVGLVKGAERIVKEMFGL